MHSLPRLCTHGTPTPLPLYTYITAHSGAENTQDNSLSSLGILAGSGCDFLELDIQPHLGRLFLCHDELAEDSIEAPTLEEAFSLISSWPQIPYINCDMKQEGLAMDLFARAQAFHLEDRIVCTGSLSQNDAAFLQNHFPKAYWQNLYGSGEEIVEKALVSSAFALNINHQSLSIAQVRHLVCQGKRLSLWTVDGLSAIEALLKEGIYNLTTHKVAAAIHLRGHLQPPLF